MARKTKCWWKPSKPVRYDPVGDTARFKPVKGFEDYEICEDGRLVSYRTRFPKLMRSQDNGHGYLVVCLRIPNFIGPGKYFLISRLVALAFIPNPKNLSDVSHIDQDKSNNHYTNLEWTSRTENLHRERRRLNKPIMTEDEVRDVRKRHSQGVLATQLAREKEINVSVIHKIVARRSYKHVK